MPFTYSFQRITLCGVFFIGAISAALEAPPPGFEWKKIKQFEDATHRHETFELYYKGRRVVDHYAKEHSEKSGRRRVRVQSSINTFFDVEMPAESREAYWVEQYRKTLAYEKGPFPGKVKGASVVWLNPKTKAAVPALELLVHYPDSMIPRRIIVDEKDGRLLEEKQVARNVDVAVKVYETHPGDPDSPAVADDATVTVNEADKLVDAGNRLRVRRGQSGAPYLIHVDPQTDFYGDGAFTNGSAGIDNGTLDLYNSSCNSALATACPNQSFDAVNVYYHIYKFRDWLDTQFAALGATVTFEFDPLDAVINPRSFTGTSSNNAMYIDAECDDGTNTLERCLLFLRPATLSGAVATDNCGQTPAPLYHTAREAAVVIHEYQHYVTDVITDIVFGSSELSSFGDALHEGYSDYFAATFLSAQNSPTNVTLVGEFFLKDCVPLQRDVQTIRPFNNDESDEDPHASGLSWASGLWQLREDYGATIADRLAMKSLFFLSTDPGAMEAVEAVVQADEALYAGAHVERIREIFYEEIKFVGGSSDMFKNPKKGIIEMGFKGCAGTHGGSAASPIFSGLFFFLSFLSTIVVGRWRVK